MTEQIEMVIGDITCQKGELGPERCDKMVWGWKMMGGQGRQQANREQIKCFHRIERNAFTNLHTKYNL